jgi:quercetin dioxygenase-like cupin family protein
VVRITRWDFAPGAATGWHTHGWPYFVVLLTDAVMKIETADGAVSEVRLQAGQSYQRPAGIEHDVMNGAAQPMAFVEIEIKQPDALVQAKKAGAKAETALSPVNLDGRAACEGAGI